MTTRIQFIAEPKAFCEETKDIDADTGERVKKIIPLNGGSYQFYVYDDVKRTIIRYQPGRGVIVNVGPENVKVVTMGQNDEGGYEEEAENNLFPAECLTIGLTIGGKIVVTEFKKEERK